MNEYLSQRLDRFRRQMAEMELDGFLVTQPENRRYLSGFTGSAGVLVITPERHALATDSRYYEQVRQECPEWELVEAGYSFTDRMLEILRDLGLGGCRVGFEAAQVSVSSLLAWERALQGRVVLVHTEGFVEHLRMQKDAEELRRIRAAASLADAAYEHLLTRLRPGMTEREAAWELESYMRTHGASGVSFEVIVAAGPNAAKPHAVPTDRPIQAGESIVLDWGCVVDGYCSDITRSFCLDRADERYTAIWQVVRQAQEAAIQGARAGIPGSDVDRLARDVIAQAGYGDRFGHSLGHGVGLAIHEGPRYSFTYAQEVPAGAVMTIEPGIYIPGWGGVRLEDMVVVTDGGVELLTASPKVPVVGG